MVPDELTFEGRPQLVARFRGSGGGRTLLLNGHVDVVDVEPRGDWTQADPFAAEIRDGRLYGRGACDMKGGVASMVVAACTLAELGVPLAGDLIVNTVTEEESTGAGGLFAARLLAGRRGDRARSRAASPSGSRAAAACCRASRCAGRAGHAGIAPLPPEQGGAVNAIEKMALVLDAVRACASTGRSARAIPTSRPATACRRSSRAANGSSPTRPSCTLECHIEYLPDRADEHGYGAARRARVRPTGSQRRRPPTRGCASIPPRSSGASAACPRPRSPRTTRSCRRCSPRPRPRPARRLGGLDNWHDGATLTVEAGIPAVCFGPGDVHRAHTADEYVPIDDLVACAQRIALAAMRFCG